MGHNSISGDGVSRNDEVISRHTCSAIQGRNCRESFTEKRAGNGSVKMEIFEYFVGMQMVNQ